jgi:hypothetical protein
MVCARPHSGYPFPMSNVIYAFRVSDELFRLTTEAIRTRSLATRRFETVSSTALYGLEKFLDMPDFELMLERAATIEDNGENRVGFRIQIDQKALFQAARDRATTDPTTPATARFLLTVSMLCVFDCAIRRRVPTNAKKILTASRAITVYSAQKGGRHD